MCIEKKEMTELPALRLENEAKYSDLLKLSRKLDSIFSQYEYGTDQQNIININVALVGSHTLSFLSAPLSVHLASKGINAKWFVGEFDNYRQELLDLESELYKFEPKVVIVLVDHHDIRYWPEINDLIEAVNKLATNQLLEWQMLWENINQKCGSTIIHSNIAIPCERPFGNLELKIPGSRTTYLQVLNHLIATQSPSYVHVIDMEYLSGYVGKQVWFDEAARYNSGQGFGFKALTSVSRELSNVISGIFGKSKKCLVLDLDNTLWGGIIGDSGVEGISLDRGDPVGEAYIDFQLYCRRLKERGILLAVCSKNDIENAMSPFLQHPEMILKLDDISVFKANWNDKATNIKEIAQELNLGLDSFVFIDDNPAERALVREFAPEVAVPELPDDPAYYMRALDRMGYFETSSVSSEDFVRANFYASEHKRKQSEVSANNLEDFLKSLNQVCKVGAFDSANLQRITQLINKTNQWNLTTQRMTEGEVRTCMDMPHYLTLWIRHKDCFGDSGLISVLIAHQVDQALIIENWLMSCRVIKRGVEYFIFEYLVKEAKLRGIKFLKGTYKPTVKNAMVSDFYKKLGFKCTEKNDDDSSEWVLDIDGDINYSEHFIKLDVD